MALGVDVVLQRLTVLVCHPVTQVDLGVIEQPFKKLVVSARIVSTNLSQSIMYCCCLS